MNKKQSSKINQPSRPVLPDDRQADRPTSTKSGGGNLKTKKYEFKFDLKKIFIIVIVGLFALSFLSLLAPTNFFEKKPLSKILNDVKRNKIKKIQVDENRLTVFYKNDEIFTSFKETDESLVKTFESADIDPKSIELEIKDNTGSNAIVNLLINAVPIVLMVVFFLFIFRQARGAQDSIFSFGTSKAKLFDKGKQKVTFADVAGVDEAKEELEEIVDFLRHPQKYRALGARTPKGVLLVGPSGTGKTLLARAVAGEAGVPFYSMAGSEFMEMLVGVGASRVRDLFSTAKKNAPSIVFIDEIDAIGRTRTVGTAGGHDEREQTLNQILVEMDGFTPNDQVMILAATNRGDLLDRALLRPGRFDRRITLDMPDIEGREKILKIHKKGKPFTKSVNWEKVARRTVGFSGADIENMLNEAAILAARRNKKEVGLDEIEEAATKVKLGPEKKRLLSKLDKKIIAYHEAGHAVVTYHLPKMDPIHRVSIVSRGLALGFTLIPPKKDRYHETRSHLIEQISSLLGGRAAEKIIFNELTGGAANDIQKATEIAKAMVIDYGMSDLGPINFGPKLETTEWGGSFIESRRLSPAMQEKIDNEIKKIIDSAHQKAQDILKKHKEKLDAVAQKLLDQETIDADEFKKIMKKKT